MIEVFRYSVSGTINDETSIAPRMATRPFIQAVSGVIIKGSGRTVDENLLGRDEQVIQGFTGEQVSYLRELISLGSITSGVGDKDRPWLTRLIANRLVSSAEPKAGKIEYDITPLGRAAVSQLL